MRFPFSSTPVEPIGSMYSGISFVGASGGFTLPLNSGNRGCISGSPFTPPLNSGVSTIGGSMRFPFSSTPVEPIGSVYSGISFVGASGGVTPPVNSGDSSCVSGSPFTPPLYSGASTTGGSMRFPFSSTPVEPIGSVYAGTSFVGASGGFTPPVNSGCVGGVSGIPLS